MGASQNLGLHSARPEVIVSTADEETMERSLTDVPAVTRYLYGVPPPVIPGRYLASVASATREGGSMGDPSLRSEIVLAVRHRLSGRDPGALR